MSTVMKESKKILFHKLIPKQPKWLKEYMERYKESNLFKRIAKCIAKRITSFNIFDKGQSLIEPQEIANDFNKYFCKDCCWHSVFH